VLLSLKSNVNDILYLFVIVIYF